MLARIGDLFRFANNERRFRKVFRKYREFTMVPENIYTGNLHLASTVRSLSGAVVECGTWRGGMIAGIADVLGPHRHYRLFDSYEGLPPAQAIDGEAALAWQRDTSNPGYYDNCRASDDQARQAMSQSAATDYTLVKGWFNDTLPVDNVGPIALLRMDADWYDSTKAILDNLAGRVVPGGLIIVDDYYVYQGCTRAVNEYAAAKSWMIRQYHVAGICYIIA
jgi:O-methyltransferase